MDIITLEDFKDYIILDILEIENTDYVYLVLVTDKEKKNVCIRKVIDNGTNLGGLESDLEYKKALNAYNTKYRNIVNVA